MVSTFLHRARKQQLAASGMPLAVASVSVLFNPERWVAQWRALGGYLTVGQWPVVDGEPTLLDLAPTLPPAEPWDSPRRRQATHLRAALAMPGARERVIDYLQRMETTRGRQHP